MSSPLVVETARAWLRGRGRDEGGGGGGWAGAVRERVAWTALEQSALERRVTALETRATSSSLTTMVTATTTTTTAPNESSDRRRAVGVCSSTCQTDEQSPGASQRRSPDIYIQRHHLKRSVSTEEPAAAPAAPGPPPHHHCLETAAPVPPSSSLVSRPPPKGWEDAKREHTSLTRVLGDVKTNKEKAFRSGNEWKKILSPEMFTVLPMSGLVPGVLRRTRSPTSTAVEGRLLDLEERIKILEKSVVDVDRGGKSMEGRDIEDDLMFVHPDAIALERCRSVCKSILGSEVDISITTAPSWHRRVDDPRAARGCTVSRGVTADDGTYSVPEWERTNRRKMDHGSLLFRDEGTDAQLVIIRPNHVVPRIDRRFPQSVGVQFSAFPMMFEAYTQASDEPKDESEYQRHTEEDNELGGSLQEKDDHEPKPQTSKEKDESGHRRNTLHKNVSLHSIVSIRSVRSESGHRSQSDLRKFQQKDNEPVYHHHSQVPSVYPWMEPWKLRRHDGICCGCGPNKQCLRTHKNKNGSMMERTSRAWSMKHGPSMDYRSSYWGPDSDKHKASRPIVRMRRHDDDDDMEPKAIKSFESISDPRLGLRGDWSDKETDGEQGAGWAWRNVEERPSHSPDGSTKGDQPTGGKSPAFPGQLNDPGMGTDLFMGVQRLGSDTSLTSAPLRAASNGEPPPTPGPPPPTPAPATQDAKRGSLGGRPGRDLRGGERGTGRGKRSKASRAAKAAKASSSRRRFSVCVRPASHRGVGVVSVDVYTGCPPRVSRPVVSNYCLPPPYCAPVPNYCPPGCNGGYRRRYAW